MEKNTLRMTKQATQKLDAFEIYGVAVPSWGHFNLKEGKTPTHRRNYVSLHPTVTILSVEDDLEADNAA